MGTDLHDLWMASGRLLRSRGVSANAMKAVLGGYAAVVCRCALALSTGGSLTSSRGISWFANPMPGTGVIDHGLTETAGAEGHWLAHWEVRFSEPLDMGT